MTDIKQRALALVNEIEREEGATELTPGIMRLLVMDEALCRAIEQHEAFRQEVSDELIKQGFINASTGIGRFIIPKPKPDPLVDVFCKGLWSEAGLSVSTKEIRAALDALGFEIREKEQSK